MVDNRPGCLSGILRLLLLGWLFDWAEHRFGFGRGCSCSGFGCGLLLLAVFLLLVCSTVFNTNWFHP